MKSISLMSLKLGLGLGLGLALSLSSLKSFAANESTETKVNISGSVSLNGLGCFIGVSHGLGQETRLNDLTIFHNDKEIKLRHKMAMMPGCDIPNLLALSESTRLSYGFVYMAPIEITRLQSKPTNNYGINCTANVREILKIDLGRGVVVRSEEVGTVKVPCS